MHGGHPSQRPPQMNNFRQRLSSLSQMEKIRQNPSRPFQAGNTLQSGNGDGIFTGNTPDPSSGSPPYWLNPLYLAAILAQNNRPNYIVAPASAPASVSTSCGPRGCSASAGTAGSVGPLTSGSSVSGRPPTRPTNRPSVGSPSESSQRPQRPQRPPPNTSESTRPTSRPLAPGPPSNLTTGKRHFQPIWILT